MRLGKDLQNKPIYSVTDGRLLGTVKDIYLTDNLDQINAVYLGSEGLIKRKHFLITTENVVVFGIDAMLVKNKEVVATEEELPESEMWVRLSKLRGRQIDTTGGTKVASIGDIIIDDHGQITGFALSRVYVEGPVADKGSISRTAVVDTGNEDGMMTIDLALAENPDLTAMALPPVPDAEPATETAPSSTADVQLDSQGDETQKPENDAEDGDNAAADEV